MACSNTFKIFDKQFNRSYTVPCNFCLNCRVDRRNFLEDCCRFSEDKHGTSAFVCLTYDDYHLPDNLSLRRDDFTKFIKRLRRYLDYHAELVDGLLINNNFDYLAVGEYGDTYNRPHYHVLFFGLDSRALEPILSKLWYGGIIDCAPLLNGGIRYVLSYLEKNIKGALAKELYDNQGLERPFTVHNRGLCTDFILSHYDEIMLNHGSYSTGKPNQLRPIPQYWRKILCTKPFIDLNKIKKTMFAHGVKFSLKNYNTFRHQQALIRQQKLTIQTRRKGYPVPDNLYLSNYHSSRGHGIDIDFALYGDKIPF